MCKRFDHQKEAAIKIHKTLEEHDRATAVMACGTGKTLLALFAAEDQVPKNTIVLVPSLALLSQTLKEWLKHNTFSQFKYCCVCSDTTVQDKHQKDADELTFEESDLPFPVGTNSKVVNDFLSHEYDGVRCLFTTYHSAQVVADGMPDGFSFDFGIFDEAHKTAGKHGNQFGYALHNENLTIAKRLFLTATPRIHDVNHKDADGEARLIVSMDDEAIYGPVAYRLTFGEAVERGLICGYKVLVSVITSADLPAELIQSGETMVNGVVVTAKQVAHQIAIKKAIEDYGLRKVITYHESVAAAKRFTSLESEGIGYHLDGFKMLHVNGAMKMSDRADEMAVLEDPSEKVVISNARCLTEGVDVPSVDMVAFVSPRSSVIDIAQAAGRAMRLSDGKSTGYILVPVYIDSGGDGATDTDVMAKSDYKNIFQVLEAMADNDVELAEIIRKLRVSAGRGEDFDGSGLRDKFEVIGSVTLDALKQAIEVRAMMELSSSFDEMFGRLEAYKTLHGDCNVLKRYAADPALGGFVGTLRKSYKKGYLSPEKIVRLEAIGMDWAPYDSQFEENFRRLAKYAEIHGECNVPIRYAPDPALGILMISLRQSYKKGRLSPDQITRLEAIGMDWAPLNSRFEENYRRLVDYAAINGHCNIPNRYAPDPSLRTLVSYLRKSYKKGRLSPDQITRLEAIGMKWVITK